jgi:phosphopantothenoylcysteine synthetase/decarboxylase
MKNKSIVLGVTGSIAAYKAADLVSKLIKLDYDVTVIMTESAKKLISDQTFLTLSRNPVISDLWSVDNWKPEHIQLAEKSSLFVVAPCTANFIGKYAAGIADDALTTYALSHKKKVLLAPAMHADMWEHVAVQDNCKVLMERGVYFIGPDIGNLACGITGKGHISDISSIVAKIGNILKNDNS